MNILKTLLKLTVANWKVMLLGVFLACLTVSSNIGLMAISAFLLSWSAMGPPVLDLMPAIAAVRFFGLSRAVFRYLERYVTHKATLEILGRMRVWLYKSMESQPPGPFSNKDTSKLFTGLIADVESLKDLYLRVLLPPATALLIMVLVFGVLFYLEPSLAFAFLLIYLITGIGLPFAIKFFSQEDKRLTQARSGLEALLVDSLQGMTDLLVFGQEKEQLAKVASRSEELTRLKEKLAGKEALVGILTNLMAHLAMVAILILGIPLVQTGRLQGVWFAALGLGVLSAFEAIGPLAQVLPYLEECLAAGRRILGIIPSESDNTHGKTVVTAQLSIPETLADKESLTGQRYSLKVNNLSFTYPGTEQPALEYISFNLPAGKSMAIVGPSGAGKTTLLHLLLRFWDYSAGSICLEGREIREYEREELWSLVGVVSRQTHLFYGTIRDNLLLAKPDATQKDLIRVAGEAQLLPFIESLPRGFDTPIGEEGWKLSGGQRQLLAIARAFLKDAPILFLDEATEGLDRETEKLVLTSIKRLMAGRTTLIITHRLAELQSVDRLLVLENGKVAESGSPEQLLKQEGLFRRLHALERQANKH